MTISENEHNQLNTNYIGINLAHKDVHLKIPSIQNLNIIFALE